MTMNDQERELSTRLHIAADALEVPGDLLLRVRQTAARQAPPADNGKRARWLMPALVAAAVVAGCVLFAVTPSQRSVPAVVQPVAPHSAPVSGFVWDQLGHRSTTTAPDLRTPQAVVTGYLNTARAGRCEEAAAIYWAPRAWEGPRGDLCEDSISDFVVGPHEAPSTSAKSDVVAATLTTAGSSDATVPSGNVVWFFQLERQPDGSWRITEGGSGP